MKNFHYVLCLLTISVVSACGTKSDCFREYQFEFPASITPNNDTISIGDTLWLELNVDNLIEDIPTGELMDFSSYDYLYFDMIVSRYDTNRLVGQADDFEFLLTRGEFIESNRNIAKISFTKDEDKNFKLAIIPQETGGYSFTFALSIENLLNEPPVTLELNGCNCPEPYQDCVESFSNLSDIVVNENIHKNLHLLEDAYILSISQFGDVDTLYIIPEGTEYEDIKSIFAFYVQ